MQEHSAEQWGKRPSAGEGAPTLQARRLAVLPARGKTLALPGLI
jgi:hypothetical protein